MNTWTITFADSKFILHGWFPTDPIWIYSRMGLCLNAFKIIRSIMIYLWKGFETKLNTKCFTNILCLSDSFPFSTFIKQWITNSKPWPGLSALNNFLPLINHLLLKLSETFCLSILLILNICGCDEKPSGFIGILSCCLKLKTSLK